MKRILTAAAIVGMLGFGVFAPHAHAVSTFATNEEDGGAVTLAKDEIKDGAYYAAAQTVTVDGTVNGDVYCAGQHIYINGTVNGDVLCAGQMVTIRGTVSGDVRTAGQMVEIAGTVSGNVSSFSQQTTLASGAIVKGDLNGASQLVTINGVVDKDVVLGAQQLTVGGQVKGDVNVDVEKLTLSSSPAIGGDLAYRSPQDLSIDKARVGGTVAFTRGGDANSSTHDYRRTAMGMVAMFAMTMLVGCVLSAVTLAAVAPRYYERSFNIVNKKLGQAILVGFAVVVGAPMLAILLIMTGVLLPLGVIVFVASALLSLLSFSFAAYYTGRWVFANVVRHSILVMLVGAIILAILALIPVINFITFVAIHILGVGGIVLSVTNGYKKPVYTLPIKK